MFLFILLWILSPLVLIPLLIWALNRKSKLTDFLMSLFQNGRISGDELKNLHINQPVNSINIQNPTTYPQQFAPNNCNPYNAPYPYAYSQPVYNNNNYQNKSKTNSTVALLIIGVVFVILAGIIFSTATWLYMNGLQRTGIIALAGLFFFAVSVLCVKKLKLHSTGMAFYLLGSAFTAITFAVAGYFKIFGKWFSLQGDGCYLLLSCIFLVVTIFLALARKFFSKSFFVHSSLYSGLVSLTFAVLQFTDSYQSFILTMNIFTALLVFTVFRIKPAVLNRYIRPVQIFSVVSLTLFAVWSIPCIFYFSGTVIPVYLLLILFGVQSFFYGIRLKNNVFKDFACIFTILLSVHISVHIVSESIYSYLAFAIIIFVISLAFRYIRYIRTAFTDIILNIVLFLSGYGMIIEYHTDTARISGAIIFGLSAILSVFFALEKGKAHNMFFRILLPLPIMIMADELGLYFQSGFSAISVCTVILTVISLYCVFIPDRHNIFTPLHYAFSAGGAIMLIYTARLAYTIPQYILVLVLSTALFGVCLKSKVNVTSFIPIFCVYFTANEITQYLTSSVNAQVLTFSLIFLLLSVISRLTFPHRFIKADKGFFRIDTSALSAVISPYLILSVSFNGYHRFIAVMLLSVFALNFYRKNNKRLFNLISLTVSSAFLSLAVFIQPFFHITDRIILHKFNLIPVLIFNFLLYHIWKKEKSTADVLCFTVNLIAYLMTVYDSFYFDDLFNTLFALSISLIILLYSYLKRKKSWFVISISFIVIITIYAMRYYLALISWWVYLLIAGILLIATASANEYFKSRGESLKMKIKNFFSK